MINIIILSSCQFRLLSISIYPPSRDVYDTENEWSLKRFLYWFPYNRITPNMNCFFHAIWPSELYLFDRQIDCLWYKATTKTKTTIYIYNRSNSLVVILSVSVLSSVNAAPVHPLVRHKHIERAYIIDESIYNTNCIRGITNSRGGFNKILVRPNLN